MLILDLKLLIGVVVAVTSFITSHPLDSKDEISLSHFKIIKRLGGGGKKREKSQRKHSNRISIVIKFYFTSFHLKNSFSFYFPF